MYVLKIVSWFFDGCRMSFIDHVSALLETKGKEVDGHIKLDTGDLPLQSFLVKGWDMTPTAIDLDTLAYGFDIHRTVHGKMAVTQQEHHKFLKACVRYIVTIVTNHLLEEAIFVQETELEGGIWFVDTAKFNTYINKIKYNVL
jgi:hypothetical protein